MAKLLKRVKMQYCKVILVTSLVWFLIYMFVLMYFTDCMYKPCNSRKRSDDKRKPPLQPGLLDKLLPKALRPNSFPDGPGEWGNAVSVPDHVKEIAKEKFKINQFNIIASDMMSLNRSLPDYRLDVCKNKEYPATSDLPRVSVIVVFHNEAWSTLLRTVWSIINRTPHALIAEILLIDDASERDELGDDLVDYAARLPVRVHVVRTKKRIGLIQARLKGASQAKGEVLVFLDAHCECTFGWLEPLLTEIKHNRTSVACPIIDVISDDTFEYITGSDLTWGGFNWKLNFRWYPVPQREMQRRGGDRSIPTRTPTMAGGLFAIDKSYFYEIGSYDEGMIIWGAENLEISFRIWMCGGQILIVTCSRVGHVFRKTSPYSWPGGVAKIINHNTMRIVEVWMDGYKDFFIKINPGVKFVDYGDISARKKLRRDLKCKSFRWYLENIYPESQMPVDYSALGEVRNKENDLCLDSMGRKSGEKVGIVHCHGQGGNQVFSYNANGAIQTDDLCLDVSSLHGQVNLLQCHGLQGNQLWKYDTDSSQLIHSNTNQCLSVPQSESSDVPIVGCGHRYQRDGNSWTGQEEDVANTASRSPGRVFQSKSSLYPMSPT